MSFDQDRLLRLTAEHGAVVRVVVAEVAGSAPREPGTTMVVWADGQDGTIGGGALEWEAAARARAMLAEGAEARVHRMALGPSLGQCCGGAVTLLSERWDAARVAAVTGPLIARPLPGRGDEMPLAVRRLVAGARAEGRMPSARLVQGWLVEPFARPGRDIWIWGAGHVGRAIVAVLAPVPGLRITWIDTAEARFPETIPEGVARRVATNPAELVTKAPAGAEHLVLTFSHALDLELCRRLLAQGFRSLGLIGSATKWARFRSRLAALGHAAGEIDRIRCPIGDPGLGKHPQAIAIGVAAQLLKASGAEDAGGISAAGERQEGGAGDDGDDTSGGRGDFQDLSRRQGQ